MNRRLEAARQSTPTQRRLETLSRDLHRVRKTLERLLTAYQEELLSLDELRARMPALRQREQAVQAELHALNTQAADRTAYLRLAETLTAFLERLRSHAQILDISERQRIMRLLVKEVIVGKDTITIKRSIPECSGPSGDNPGTSKAPGLSNTAQSTKVILCVHGVVSPLLANLYLHPLDERLMARGYRMVRYADDFVVLCARGEEAEAALALIRDWVAENGLTLHPDKTPIGDCRPPGEGFDFLGYRFEAGKRWVRKKSLQRFKDGIRVKLRRTRGESLARIIADLNPTLRGWFGYFKQAHSSTFRKGDGFIRRRLRALLRKPEKRPGTGRCQADHHRWPNAFFAAAGLFALYPAWQAERHSR